MLKNRFSRATLITLFQVSLLTLVLVAYQNCGKKKPASEAIQACNQLMDQSNFQGAINCFYQFILDPAVADEARVKLAQSYAALAGYTAQNILVINDNLKKVTPEQIAAIVSPVDAVNFLQGVLAPLLQQKNIDTLKNDIRQLDLAVSNFNVTEESAKLLNKDILFSWSFIFLYRFAHEVTFLSYQLNNAIKSQCPDLQPPCNIVASDNTGYILTTFAPNLITNLAVINFTTQNSYPDILAYNQIMTDLVNQVLKLQDKLTTLKNLPLDPLKFLSKLVEFKPVLFTDITTKTLVMIDPNNVEKSFLSGFGLLKTRYDSLGKDPKYYALQPLAKAITIYMDPVQRKKLPKNTLAMLTGLDVLINTAVKKAMFQQNPAPILLTLSSADINMRTFWATVDKLNNPAAKTPAALVLGVQKITTDLKSPLFKN